MKTIRAQTSVLWLLAVLLLLGGCEKAASPTKTEAAPSATASTWFPLTIGDQKIRVQLAVLPEERQHGLMQRKELGENDGMIFLFEQPQQMSFWMYNTLIPLSVGYLSSDGVLREIYWMYPQDRTAVPSRLHDLRFALEMNQGWFKLHGVKPGAQLDLDQLRAALIARGLDPATYGL